MLGLFRTNQFIVNILLLFYAGVLHLSVFIWPDQMWEAPVHGLLSAWIYQLVGSVGTLADALAIVLVFIQAVILNTLFANNRITRENTLFPGLFYILMASALPELLHLSPLLLANTFYLLAFRELFTTYRQPEAAGNIFNAGFWIGVASLFYFSLILLLVWGMIALNSLRAFRLQERFMLLIGTLVPYLLVGVYFFYIGRWDEWIQLQFVRNFDWLDLPPAPSPGYWIKLGFWGLILLFLLLNYGNYSGRQTIDVQKKINLMYWGLFFGGLSVFIQAGVTIDHAAVLAIPMGMLLSLAFVQLSSRWAEAWHLLLLAIVLFFQYQSYFLPLFW